MSDIVPNLSATERPFEALMAVEGRWTGDDRLIMVDGLSWEGLLPMSVKMSHAPDAKCVGRIDAMERVPGATADERFVLGRGVMDLGCPEGAEAARQIEGGYQVGVSIEPDNITEGGVDPAQLDDPEDAGWMLVVESARVRSLALTPTPAFAEAYITLGILNTATQIPAIDGPTPLPHDEVPEIPDVPIPISIVAGGHTITIPECPPAEWFTEPTDVEIDGALTVTDEGRVYGLLAPANVAHIGRPDGMTVPMNVDYSRFLRGETVVDGGARVVTGNLTMNCGHNAAAATPAAVTEHYDNSCSLVATVACGERAGYGVWIAGALLPGVTPDQVRRMMACQVSGHWMTDGVTTEMLGALLVPVAGYPMARRKASVTLRDGRLVASAVPVRFETPGPAIVTPDDCGCGGIVAAAVPAERWDRQDDIERRLAFLEEHTRPIVAAGLSRRIKGA